MAVARGRSDRCRAAHPPSARLRTGSFLVGPSKVYYLGDDGRIDRLRVRCTRLDLAAARAEPDPLCSWTA
mgnify:CR=1 FL=1